MALVAALAAGLLAPPASAERAPWRVAQRRAASEIWHATITLDPPPSGAGPLRGFECGCCPELGRSRKVPPTWRETLRARTALRTTAALDPDPVAGAALARLHHRLATPAGLLPAPRRGPQ